MSLSNVTAYTTAVGLSTTSGLSTANVSFSNAAGISSATVGPSSASGLSGVPVSLSNTMSLNSAPISLSSATGLRCSITDLSDSSVENSSSSITEQNGKQESLQAEENEMDQYGESATIGIENDVMQKYDNQDENSVIGVAAEEVEVESGDKEDVPVSSPEAATSSTAPIPTSSSSTSTSSTSSPAARAKSLRSSYS